MKEAMTRVGYVLIVLAMVLYVISALFLDYYTNEGSPSGIAGITYYEALTGRPSTAPFDLANTIGGILTGFGGPLLITVLALSGLTRRYSQARSTVVTAVAVWATAALGTSINVWGSRGLFTIGPGYWVQAACAGVAIVGVLLLFIPKAAASPTEDDPE
jgi:hypothetical protein